MANIEKYDDKEAFMKEMEGLRPDLCFPEQWSPAEKNKAAAVLRSNSVRTSMFSTIPMKCRAEKCVFAEVCPLLQEGVAPKGKSCPIEMNLVQVLMASFVEDLNVDPNNMIELAMVRDMVNQEVQQQRATWTLSMEHFIQENVVGVGSEGEPIMQKQLHLATDLEDRLHRRKKSLREQLLATREARAKAGQSLGDAAQNVSNLMEKVRQLKVAEEKAEAERLGYADRDEYTDQILDVVVVEDDTWVNEVS